MDNRAGKKPGNVPAADLRAQAERQLKGKPAGTPAHNARLVHELQVHQIELELQNEELRKSRAEIETMLENFAEFFDFAPFSYLTLRRDGVIHEINLTGATLLGLERAKLVGRRLEAFVLPPSLGPFRQLLQQAFNDDARASCEIALKSKGEHPLVVHIDAIASTSGDACRLSLTDITGRKQMEDALHESEERFRTIAENVDDLIAVLDTEGRRLYSSPSYGKIFDMEQIKAGSNSFSEIHPKDRERIKNVFMRTVASGVGERAEFRFVLKDGSVRYIESQGNAVHDASGRITKVIVVSRDVTKRRETEEQFRYLSFHDPLTSLANRMLLDDHLAQAIASAKRNDKQSLSLLFIDIDHFKQINDQLGHAAGDQLLREVARRIKNCLRESDTAARVGGDEFIVLLPAPETGMDARMVAEKIRKAILRPIDLDPGGTFRVSPSIGVAVYPQHGKDARTLLRNADAAMYSSKQSGRNTITVYSPKK